MSDSLTDQETGNFPVLQSKGNLRVCSLQIWLRVVEGRMASAESEQSDKGQRTNIYRGGGLSSECVG